MNLDYLLFTEKDILERVDEYTLYCFYLKYEPLIGGKYSSPLPERIDKDPSWGLLEAKTTLKYKPQYHEFVWKDAATGEAGNIFELVRKLYGYKTTREAFVKVCSDFGLGGAGGTNVDQPIVLLKVPRYASVADIQVASRPFNTRDEYWWRQFNITTDLLKEYTTTAIKCYWLAKEQKIPSYPKGPGYAYHEFNKYQLYFPLANKKDKFRTNFSYDLHIHGYKQLSRTDLCIITKSRKDVMCLRSFGYDAISPMSENILVPEACLKALEKRYQQRLILFDNDEKHRGADYKEPKIFVPLESGVKDTSDYCKAFGPKKTEEMLKQIIRL